jgi:chromosome segregation ATPase
MSKDVNAWRQFREQVDNVRSPSFFTFIDNLGALAGVDYAMAMRLQDELHDRLAWVERSLIPDLSSVDGDLTAQISTLRDELAALRSQTEANRTRLHAALGEMQRDFAADLAGLKAEIANLARSAADESQIMQQRLRHGLAPLAMLRADLESLRDSVPETVSRTLDELIEKLEKDERVLGVAFGKAECLTQTLGKELER